MSLINYILNHNLFKAKIQVPVWIFDELKFRQVSLILLEISIPDLLPILTFQNQGELLTIKS